MNILNKGFEPFTENGSVTTYTKVLTGKLTPQRIQFICNWIDAVNKKTEHVCYGWGEVHYSANYNAQRNEYHINIEVLNSNEL
jgi:hypothetical protein